MPQSVGLLPNQLRTLRLASTRRAERIPIGSDLQKLFESIDVGQGETPSEPEGAWLYGDQAASESAARDATGDASKKPH